MEDQGTPGKTPKRTRSILIKLAIGLAIFIGIFILSIVCSGVVATFVVPVVTPELVERVKAEKSNPEAKLAGPRVTAAKDHRTSDPMRAIVVAGIRRESSEAFLPKLEGLTPPQQQERDRVNEVYRRIIDGLAECALWDGMSFKDRERKLSELFRLQQSNGDLVTHQFNVEQNLRFKRINEKYKGNYNSSECDVAIKEAHEAGVRILETYNAIIPVIDDMLLENAVRNEQWFAAAKYADSVPEMIYYYRRSDLPEFQKFAFITTRTIERGYTGFGNRHPSLRKYMPNR
ncbi:hypothetical protein LLG95_06550 [bacterium]|nr:hypothetical protein [bacterium]